MEESRWQQLYGSTQEEDTDDVFDDRFNEVNLDFEKALNLPSKTNLSSWIESVKRTDDLRARLALNGSDIITSLDTSDPLNVDEFLGDLDAILEEEEEDFNFETANADTLALSLQNEDSLNEQTNFKAILFRDEWMSKRCFQSWKGFLVQKKNREQSLLLWFLAKSQMNILKSCFWFWLQEYRDRRDLGSRSKAAMQMLKTKWIFLGWRSFIRAKVRNGISTTIFSKCLIFRPHHSKESKKKNSFGESA